jgi:cell wall-associated NlpC family hydrolase
MASSRGRVSGRLDQDVTMESRLLLTVLALAVAASGCASSGAVGGGPVPKPFPMPDPKPGVAVAGPEAAPTAPAPFPKPADGYALVGTALELRGTPYRDGGTDPRGFDCSGFTQYVFAKHGLALPRGTRDQFRQGSNVRPDDLEPGDLLFFTTTGPGASHVGIAVGIDQFVHAPSSTGVVRVDRLSSGYWSQRFIGARRVAPTGRTKP